MNAHPQFSQSVRLAEAVIAAIKAAGIDETDPDFTTLVESECDILERLRRMFRASRIAKEEAKSARQIAKEIEDRAKRREAKAESLDALILQTLQDLGQKNLDAPDFRLSVVAGPVKVVGDAEPETLPEKFLRIKKELNKTAIKEALQSGETVEGFALSNGTNFLKVTK
jgi:hypothetical protein